MAEPASTGEHFLPRFNLTRDFYPEGVRESKAIASLEEAPLQVGLYVFGRAILDAGAEVRDYRALKGPAAITAGTPRPKWYPTGQNPVALPGALPDWRAVYPVARRAMNSFSDGGSGFEATLDSWKIAVRPVLATQERCLGCHSAASYPHGTENGARLILGQPVGGVLYAYRRAGE